jgi:hypothetical protein
MKDDAGSPPAWDHFAKYQNMPGIVFNCWTKSLSFIINQANFYKIGYSLVIEIYLNY